ncbi:hypothetical protein C8J57DRAFT_1192923 [Mycena rebaudengoi]|nr:hypothetical protein C8J57DRAFT_1192923 [Mycena rebaudengoi]
MHLAFENTAPNMYKHWSGKFKGLDTGVEDYEIPEAVWEEIWQETADAVPHIPADFVRVLGNNPSYYTAEAWCFWIVYLAPALLKGRFPHEKYYLHACQLSSIIKRCIAFKLTYTQIDILEEDIIDWVEKYEEYYYQYDESRLSACPLTIHGWLHQLGCRYDLEAELSTAKKSKSSLSTSEKIFQGYPDSILRYPCMQNNIPDPLTIKRVSAYFSAFLEKPRKRILPLLPEVMPCWGKMRIVDGDSIRSVSACGDESTWDTQRNMSFVRYVISVEDHDGSWVPRVFYGQLEEILECELPEDRLLGEVSGKTCFLAVITPCDTSGKDATEEFTDYTHMTAPIVTDLRTVEAVVGRAETQGRWVILDRAEGLVHPVFTEPET